MRVRSASAIENDPKSDVAPGARRASVAGRSFAAACCAFGESGSVAGS
jgi:hypothetical protein